MAHWIDLSAHNLALWRIGSAMDNTQRRFVLLPIFEKVKSTPIEQASAIAQKFKWNPDIQGYVYDVDPHDPQGLPSLKDWLANFSGALIRDRDHLTYSYIQDTILQVQNLPVSNPWVFRSSGLSDRFFANEEQALSYGNGKADLCQSDEVFSEGVYALNSPVEPNSLSEALEVDTTEEELTESVEPSVIAHPSNSVEPEVLNEVQSALLPADEPENASQDQSIRSDYGQYIPGARKDALEAWQNVFSEKYGAFMSGFSPSDDSMKEIEKSTKRDVIIGTLSEKLQSCENSPLKQALWKVIYKVMPASASSIYLQNKKNWNMDAQTRFARIMSYTEILKAIDRRMQNLTDNPDGASLIKLLDEDIDKSSNMEYVKKLMPGVYSLNSWSDELRDWVEDTAENAEKHSEKKQAYANFLDRIPNGVPFLLSNLVKMGEGDIAGKMMGSLFPFLQSKNGSEELDDKLNKTIKEEVKKRVRPLFDTLKSSFVQSIMYDYDHKTGKEARWERWSLPADVLTRHELSSQEDFIALPDDKRREIAMEGAEYLSQYRQDNLYKALDGAIYADALSYEYRGKQFLSKIPIFHVAWKDIQGNNQNKIEFGRLKYDEACQSMDILLESIHVAQDIIKNSDLKAEFATLSEQETSEDKNEAPNQDESISSNQEEVDSVPNFIKWRSVRLPLPPQSSKEEGYRKGLSTDRDGRAITEEIICEKFGFRGVQYGNWMTQKDRQEHLDALYDSCCDIQTLFDLPDSRMVGLPRKRDGGQQYLAVALGARGRGRFNAHYEPDLHVVNMTKSRGAGSFLHEWTHALDYFYGADITDGQAVAASELHGFSVKRNPFLNFTDTLKTFNYGSIPKESLVQAKASVLRSAQEKATSRIADTFMSEEIQKQAFYDLAREINYFKARQDMEKDGLDVSDGVNHDYVKKSKHWANEQAYIIFTKGLPVLMESIEKEIDKSYDLIDEYASSGNTPSGLYPEDVLAGNVRKSFVEPFYKYSGPRTLKYDKIGGLNAIRNWMGLDSSVTEANHVHKSGTELGKSLRFSGDDSKNIDISSALDALAVRWNDAVGYKIWKKLVNPYVNNHDDYASANKEYGSKTNFYINAQILGEYWQRDTELVARSVAAFGYDRLKEKGIENTYLTRNAPKIYSNPDVYRADSDPQGFERELFADRFFDDVLPLMKERLSEQLNLASNIMVEADEKDQSVDESQIARAFVRQSDI